ncbi:Protein SEC13 homolog [Gryllus bimaculatus]|nr:Protein SEC13 homolog [Gryllus bimaculatus]
MADTEYSDGINDIVYCSEEKRVAVCSNDMSVEIWEKAMSVPGQKRTEWFPITSWKAHSKPIRRATWAPRKYGTVLATCSCDGTVAVWEEKITNAKINL